MSWFDPDKRVLAAMEADAQADGAGFSDEVIVEVTGAKPEEDSEPSRDGA